MKHKHNYANCSFCGGQVEEQMVTVDYRVKNRLIVIENVPAGVCHQCGEQYYTAKVAKALEEIAHTNRLPSKEILIPIYTFSQNGAIGE